MTETIDIRMRDELVLIRIEYELKILEILTELSKPVPKYQKAKSECEKPGVGTLEEMERFAIKYAEPAVQEAARLQEENTRWIKRIKTLEERLNRINKIINPC